MKITRIWSDTQESLYLDGDRKFNEDTIYIDELLQWLSGLGLFEYEDIEDEESDEFPEKLSSYTSTNEEESE